MSLPEGLASREIRLIDRSIELLGWGSLAAGIAGPIVRRDLFLPGGPGWVWNHRAGLLSLFWLGIRAADRLFLQGMERSHDRWVDGVMLLGAASGLVALHLARIGSSHAYTFNVIGAAVSGADAVHLLLNKPKEGEAPSSATLWLQAVLTIVLGIPFQPVAKLAPSPRQLTIDDLPPFPLKRYGDVTRRVSLTPEPENARLIQTVDSTTGRTVIVKISLPPSFSQSMVMKEIRVRHHLFPNKSPHLIQGSEGYRLPDGRPAVILERFEGGTLDDRLKRGPLSPAEGVRLSLDYAAGLRFMHEKRVIHNDINRANLTAEGTGRIFDFGVAQIVEGSSFSPVGRGTFGYTAPECFIGSDLPDPAFSADIFSLGCSLRESLTRAMTFPHMGPFAPRPSVRGYQIRPKPLPLDLLGNSGLSLPAANALGEIIDRMIAFNPSHRYQTMDEVIEALSSWRSRYLDPTTALASCYSREPITFSGLIRGKLLGEGSFSKVYGVTVQGEELAVKLFLTFDDNLIRREREIAERLCRTPHPSIATPYGWVQIDKKPGLVMERLEGELLEDRLTREERFSPIEGVNLCLDYAGGFGHSHTVGTLHLDVQPKNLWITRVGRGKVFDFGISLVGDPHHLELKGGDIVRGRFYYNSPESWGLSLRPGEPPRPFTPASDVYSLSSCLYEMLTGREAIPRNMSEHVSLRAVSLRVPERYRDLPPPIWEIIKCDGVERVALERLDSIVRKGIQYLPEDRYQTMGEFRNALEGWRYRWFG